jgi:hypothetical protein
MMKYIRCVSHLRCTHIGLSLTVLQPAAAWYFIFIMYHFSPNGAKKCGCPLGDKELKITGKRKS